MEDADLYLLYRGLERMPSSVLRIMEDAELYLLYRGLERMPSSVLRALSGSPGLGVTVLATVYPQASMLECLLI